MNHFNEDQFEILYDKYVAMLYRIAFIYTGSVQESEDILQEVFIKLLYKAPHFSSDNHEKAWLIRTVTNSSKDYLKSSRHGNMPLNEEILADKNGEEDRNIDIRSKIIGLEEKYKTVVYLFYYEDYSVKEIAACLKLTQSAVKMRLKRAREILKTELEGYENG